MGGTWGWACQALFPQIPSTFFSRRPKARPVERLTLVYIVYARFGSKDGMIPSGNTGRLPDTMSVSCLPNDGPDPARAAPSRPRTCLHSRNLLFPMEGRRLGVSSAPPLAASPSINRVPLLYNLFQRLPRKKFSFLLLLLHRVLHTLSRQLPCFVFPGLFCRREYRLTYVRQT